MENSVKELRIGNLLMYGDEIREVSSIHNDNTIRFKDDEKGSIGCFGTKMLSIKPIPITEEILFKCGFKKNNYNNRFSIEIGYENTFCTYFYERYEMDSNPERGCFCYLELNFHNELKKSYLTIVKHLHQLQNLHFALTKNELNITL